MATLSYFATPLVVAAGATVSLPSDTIALCRDVTATALTLGDGTSNIKLPDNMVVASGQDLTLNVPTLDSLIQGTVLTVLTGGTIKLTSGNATTVATDAVYRLHT